MPPILLVVPAVLLAVGRILCRSNYLRLKLHERHHTDYDTTSWSAGAPHVTLGHGAVHFQAKGQRRVGPLARPDQETQDGGELDVTSSLNLIFIDDHLLAPARKAWHNCQTQTYVYARAATRRCAEPPVL